MHIINIHLQIQKKENLNNKFTNIEEDFTNTPTLEIKKYQSESLFHNPLNSNKDLNSINSKNPNNNNNNNNNKILTSDLDNSTNQIEDLSEEKEEEEEENEEEPNNNNNNNNIITTNNPTESTEEKIGPSSFICLALLGRGSFGEVYLVQKKSTNCLYAMKVLDKSRIAEQNIFKYAMTERNVLSIIHNPFIVGLNYAFQTNEKLFLLLDYCPGGDLAEHLQNQTRFSEPVAKFYLTEIILALGELHKKDIIFRDLKPDNVVIDSEGHAMLTDFGLSREGVYDKNIAKSFCGSIAYLAPEMLQRQGHGKAVDWYLLGVLFYEMLVGIPPFFTNSKEQIFKNISKGNLKIPNFVSKKAQRLIKLLLKKDPNKRLGSKGDVEEIKNDEYFKDVDWEKVYNKEIVPPKLNNKKNLNMFKEPRLFADDNSDDDENDGEEDFNNAKFEGWSFVQNQFNNNINNANNNINDEDDEYNNNNNNNNNLNENYNVNKK